MATFDIESIGEQDLCERYRRLALRSQAVSDTLRDGFGRTRAPIEMEYAQEPRFNAHVGRGDGVYRIELAAPVPLLTALLFERLLSDERLLPWLGRVDPGKLSYDVPFVLDPAAFGVQNRWSIALSPLRALAAGMLADLALTFIVLHEMGHVLCGHVDALPTSAGPPRLAELFAEPDPGAGVSSISVAWEADADAVAASLLVDHLADIVQVQDRHADARAIFARGNATVENVLSLTIVGLFALFCYMRGARYELGLASSHPHPFVRAHYVKDMLIMAAHQRWPLDLDCLVELIDDRLDEMLIVLEDIGLSDNARFDDAYIDETNTALEALKALRERHRPSAEPWFAWEHVAREPRHGWGR